MENLKIFVWAIWELFEHMYLKYPGKAIILLYTRINVYIFLKVVANQSLWIWHCHLGLPGGNNINILNKLPLFFDML
jgi:hypothetical protein